jgi:hypothetical protein
MKKIALFGEIVLDTWPIWLAVFGGALWALWLNSLPPTVTLDAKHWECTMTRPDGLGAKCLEYVYKGK